MTEPKPFASLSSTLLARKGQAKPAMRPQGFHVTHETHPQLTPLHGDHEDLGWNDMGPDFEHETEHLNGHDAEPIALHPHVKVDLQAEMPAVVTQQKELAREFTAALTPSSAPVRLPRALPGSSAKAAFTLRLDGDRHLRLRLVCAVQHRSAQFVVTQALDEFLERQPDNAALAKGSTK